MDFRDILRSFMGFPNASRGGSGSNHSGFLYDDSEVMDDDIEEDEHNYHPPGSGQPHFHFFSEPDDMFRHFEQHFQDMFKNFGMMDFPPVLGEIAPGAHPEHEQSSVRDQMLKPGYRSGCHGDEKVDSDLDDRVSAGDLKSLFPSTSESVETRQETQMVPFGDRQPRTFNHGSSLSIRTIVGADGKVEERREMRDSSGRTETSVTRQLGDQKHSVTTKRTQDGNEEKIEDFVNIDQESLNEFDNRWQSSRSGYQQNPDNSGGGLASLFGRFFPF